MADMKILHTDEICQILGISRRSFYRRMAKEWAVGYGFFKEKSKRSSWCIKEKDLEILVEAIQDNYFQRHKA